MPDLVTPNFGWTLPTVGAASATWGVSINTNWSSLDSTLHTGLLAISSLTTVITAPNTLVLNSGAPPAQNIILGKRNNLNRWGIIIPDGETGAGVNAGDNFIIQSYADDGSVLTNPVEIVRATGQVVVSGGGLSVATGALLSSVPATLGSTLGVSGLANFAGGISFPGYNPGHTIQFGFDGTSLRAKVDSTDLGAIVTSTTAGAYLPLSGGSITGNLAVGGTTSLAALTAAATTVSSLTCSGTASFGSTLAVSGATTLTGHLQANGGIDVGGSIGLTGAINATGNITATGLVTGTAGVTTGGAVNFPSGWKFYYNPASSGVGTNSIRFTSSSTIDAFEFDQTGDLGIGGQAYKPGGGAWANSSDARTKTVEGKYEPGLDEVLKLDPIVYRFKGNDAEPGQESSKAGIKDRSFVGLVAQEVEAIFPGMVSKRAGYIDGKPVDDLRVIDTSELIFALVNAVKTLAARVEALEAK